MQYKLQVNCPDEEEVLEQIINVASQAGAGASCNYSRVAFVTKGYSTWKSEEGAHPYIGKVGEITVQPSAKIEMVCCAEKLPSVIQAIRLVHPYEEPVIEIAKLEEINF